MPKLLRELFTEKSAPSGTRYCEARGCNQTTREGKPFCSDHVDHHPYVRALIDQLDSNNDEEFEVRRKGARAKINMNGVNATNILLILKNNGPRTVERLARETQLDEKVLDGYIAAFARQRLVDFSRTNRGSRIVRLTKSVAVIPVDVVPDQDETKESA